MKRFPIFFGGGVVVTYIGNFFYYSTYADSRGTGFFIANAFAEALPKLITVFWIIAAVVFLIWFATWWIGNNDQIKQQVLDEARKEADTIINNAKTEATERLNKAASRAIEIPKEAEKLATRLRFETEAAKHAAQEELNKLVQERQQLQADYQEGVDELENKKQGYLQEISGLQRKVEHLEENLRKAKKAGIDKLRAQGQEGAARRAEKKLEKGDFSEPPNQSDQDYP
jgi:vacuolar-type H+-ATPase subunit E/Vma4